MKDKIKGLLMAMAESEEVCDSLWNDIIHLDRGSDVLIVAMLAEMVLQIKQGIEDANTVMESTKNIKAELEKQLKNLENFSEKLLTDY